MNRNLSRLLRSSLIVTVGLLMLVIPLMAQAQTDPTISEIRIDQPSTDNDEYIELAGEPGTTLDGLTYLVIGDGTGGSGVIESVIDLSGMVIPASGYFVAAESFFGLGVADLVTTINFENGDNVTHMLVEGFTGADGDDLDTNDDGVLDSTPWAAVLDKIALIEEENPPGGTEFHYGPPTVGPDGSYVPAHAYYCEGEWNIGAYDPAGGDDTPGSANLCEPVVEFGDCGDPATLIHVIQGSGADSPEAGIIHVIEGVVVGDFQDTSTGLRGFFIQEEDDQVDGDPATSEGIFVYDNGFMEVNIGDVVRVMGTVTEYYGLTELTGITDMAICGMGTASAATVNLPVTSVDFWETVEGMLIRIPGPLYATGNYSQGRYGEVDLSVDSRLYAPTNVDDPGGPANDLQYQNDLSRIQMDDGSTSQNPEPPPYIGEDNTLRAGDTIPELIGVLHYSYGAYEVHPTGQVTFTRVNQREVTPSVAYGSLKVASLNVLNYFTTIDDGSDICGPIANLGCRGADNAEEFVRQRDKIISAITAMDADIVGLIEIENHAADEALQDLVAGLNAAVGPGTYDYIGTGPIGADAIKVAFIYQPASVTPLGGHAVLDSSVDPTFLDDKNRPALAQTFQQNASGEILTVVVNHLKSKGSDCDDLGDPDIGDGQGNCNLTREAAAVALVNWLATDPTGSGDDDFLIMGDLNAYAREDPISVILAEGYTDLIDVFNENAYSYVFYGQAGYLDHALASSDLVRQVTGTTVWHINADEPAALDYNDYNQSALYSPDPFRSSDHDPVIVSLDLYTIHMDIKPGSCKNPVNVKSRGVLPVAVLGTELFDVQAIDPGTLALAGVAPLRWAYGDATRPESCGRWPDGHEDLLLKFRTQDILTALGEVSDGDKIPLQLTGQLKEEYGGHAFAAEDVITILKKGKGKKKGFKTKKGKKFLR